MGHKLTFTCRNWASLILCINQKTKLKVLVLPPCFQAEIYQAQMGFWKSSCQLLFSGAANALSSQQPPQGFSRPSSRCRDGTGCISLLHSQKMFRTCQPPFPTEGMGHTGSGGSMAGEPSHHATHIPAEPSGDGCETTEGGQGKTTGYVWGQREDTQPHPWNIPKLDEEGLLWAWGLWGLPWSCC